MHKRSSTVESFLKFCSTYFSENSWQLLLHCVKSVQIRSFFWAVFSYIRTKYGDLPCKSPYSFRIQENTHQKKLRIWTIFTQCRDSEIPRSLQLSIKPRIDSPPHFVYAFSRKKFLMLYSINWPKIIVWLPLLLEIITICAL